LLCFVVLYVNLRQRDLVGEVSEYQCVAISEIPMSAERLATNQVVGSANPGRFDTIKFTCHGGIPV